MKCVCPLPVLLCLLVVNGVVVLCGLWWGVSASAGVAAREKALRAGAYAIDITPVEFPVIINGGMKSNRNSNGRQFATQPLAVRVEFRTGGQFRSK